MKPFAVAGLLGEPGGGCSSSPLFGIARVSISAELGKHPKELPPLEALFSLSPTSQSCAVCLLSFPEQFSLQVQRDHQAPSPSDSTDLHLHTLTSA